MTQQPSQEEILKFIDVFNTLNQFSAQTQYIRGYGAYGKLEKPMPEVVKVIEWLKFLSARAEAA